ncbi:hypothetical protein [Bifidobacterium asteroides]|uniref:hypothetical protein n=1 Tax=Bifidobacterium asteroides TaxID=1684 RepID=UPI002741F4A7|nr:hypothetical protein [Bifidobacterium asteroides]WLT11056.1 hypothetical protein RAM15_02005 [Bifidobacterium asteroides]
MPEQDSQSDVDPRQDTGTDDDQNPLAMAEIDNDWGPTRTTRTSLDSSRAHPRPPS